MKIKSNYYHKIQAILNEDSEVTLGVMIHLEMEGDSYA